MLIFELSHPSLLDSRLSHRTSKSGLFPLEAMVEGLSFRRAQWCGVCRGLQHKRRTREHTPGFLT